MRRSVRAANIGVATGAVAPLQCAGPSVNAHPGLRRFAPGPGYPVLAFQAKDRTLSRRVTESAVARSVSNHACGRKTMSVGTRSLSLSLSR